MTSRNRLEENGTFTPDTDDYSPAALVLLDFAWRLAGVRQEGELLEWNIRPPARGVRSSYSLRFAATHVAEIRYQSGNAELFLDNKLLCRTNNVVRLVTSLDGTIEARWASLLNQLVCSCNTLPGTNESFHFSPTEV